MTTHRAECACGQLALICEGAPVRTGVCHCFACKRNTGSAFSFGATFRGEQVRSEGEAKVWVAVAPAAAAEPSPKFQL